MNNHSTQTPLQLLAQDVFETLAGQFPVCLASDEFHFFPHYQSSQCDWSSWDDFTPERMMDITGQIARWQQKLGNLSLSPTETIDADMIERVLTTLNEQFGLVRCHQTQPSFYLTIVSMGLADAWEAGRHALAQRVATLPGFIDQIQHNLEFVPALFRELALDMIAPFSAWFALLPVSDKDRIAAVEALQRLAENLRRCPVIEGFQLPENLYARVAARHMGCAMTLGEIAQLLDDEIAATKAELNRTAARISPGAPWQAVIESLPALTPPDDDRQGLFGAIITQLKEHCIGQQLAARALTDGCPVHIRTIPDHLLPVRSNAAYSMPPGHPPAGGTFYILPEMVQIEAPSDYRLLAAHETFPGHHLLDSSRWQLPHPVRRPIEFPLFYEGWASFSEEILFDTGFFNGPADRLLMAKRRFWRAMRGRTDLDIHTAGRTLQEAAAILTRHGLAPDQAAAMVRRYTLKPGYQLAYTIGRCKFRRLYDIFRAKGRTAAEFVQTVLGQGEIGFDQLEAILALSPNPEIVKKTANMNATGVIEEN